MGLSKSLPGMPAWQLKCEQALQTTRHGDVKTNYPFSYSETSI